MHRVSRMTVIFIWPGYWRSVSMRERQAAGNGKGAAIVHLLGQDKNPQFASGLDGEGTLDSGIRVGQLLQILNALEIGGHIFGAGAGSRGADGVGGADQDSYRAGGGNVVMVGSHAVDDEPRTRRSASNISPPVDGVGSFDLVIDGLADIVEEAGPFGRRRRPAPMPAIRPTRWATSTEWSKMFCE